MQHFYPRTPNGVRLFSSIDRHKAQRNFYPRTPNGVRPHLLCNSFSRLGNFYPRTPNGVRRSSVTANISSNKISIHALQTECDIAGPITTKVVLISIHALQTECDVMLMIGSTLQHYFYPRTPNGVRLRRYAMATYFYHFYPRTPNGVRPLLRFIEGNRMKFLSTHSKRSAT